MLILKEITGFFEWVLFVAHGQESMLDINDYLGVINEVITNNKRANSHYYTLDGEERMAAADQCARFYFEAEVYYMHTCKERTVMYVL